MKKIFLAATVLAVATAGIQTAAAGDREWAVAGKVLTGLAIAGAVTHAIEAPHYPRHYAPAHYSPPPRYCPPPRRVVYAPPVYCAPAPVVVYGPPVYYRTAPVYAAPRASVSFHFESDRRHHRGHHRRW